jgi:hypothetical protein
MANAQIGTAAESVWLQLLVNALMFVAFPTVAPAMLESWIGKPVFPDTIATAVAQFNAFAESQRFQVEVLY